MQYFQLKVTLKDIKPPIWRRILVSPEITLFRLHDVLQIVMGWTNSHLHQFETPEGYFADPSYEIEETESSRKRTLASVLDGPKSSIRYEYDFGDGWEHQILLEKVVDMEDDVLAVCTEGKRACPPEDCGGSWGYENLLEALKDPKNPQHDELAEWVPEDFDSEYFDLEAINKQLASLTRPRPKKAPAKKAASKSATKQ